MKLKKHGSSKEILALRTLIQVMQPEMDMLSKKSIRVLRKFLPELSGTFLDVGCYGGWVFHFVKDKVEYTGIDSWDTAIEVSRMLWGQRFECASFLEYQKQHDIVWCSHIQPEHILTEDSIEKLMSLSKKLLVIVDSSIETTCPSADQKGNGWVAFRK